MLDMPEEVQRQVFILDPLMTYSLFNPQGKFEPFFAHFDINQCKYIVYPYFEK